MTRGKIIANNKRARHEYFIEEEFEAGIVLTGTEVKSIRQGKVSIKEAYCQIKNGEAFIIGMHIAPFEQGNRYNPDPLRTRKLLLHKREINKIFKEVQQAGYTLVPLNVKLWDGFVKVDIGLAKGKKLYDKRDVQRKKDDKRQVERALKERYR